MSAKRIVNKTRLISCVAMVLSITAGNVFSQGAAEYDTARVPVTVNVAATVAITPPYSNMGVGRTLNVAVNTETEFMLLLKKDNGYTSASNMQQRLASTAISVGYNSGNISLRLNAQQYSNASVSLYSLNGRRIVRDRATATQKEFRISRPNIAQGVYLLSIVGTNGNSYTTRFVHKGGKLSINASFVGDGFSLRKQTAADDYGTWTITASVGGFKDTSYQFNPVNGINLPHNIKLFPDGWDSLTDERDGKTYRTVVMPDGKTWMAENLNYDTANGIGSMCYGYKPENCIKYGRLYNMETVMAGATGSDTDPSGVRGVCPSGWHLPGNAEWEAMINSIGGDATAGTKLRAKSGWYDSGSRNGNGTDDFGFSAIPGGRHRANASSADGESTGAYWWSATEEVNPSFIFKYGWTWYTEYYSDKMQSDYERGTGYYSVRCVRINDKVSITVDANMAIGGTVSPLGTSFHDIGESVTVTAIPNSDYDFIGWTAVCGTLPPDIDAANAEITFNVNSNVNIMANFRLSSTPLYLVTVDGGIGGGNYAAGDAVTITATVPDGKEFVLWTTTTTGVTFANITSATTTFIMPSRAITVTAYFRYEIKYGTLTDPRDGKTYRTVVMPDGKTWMADNLNYNGSGWCYNGGYYADPTLEECDPPYGRLYSSGSARTTACPAGWHLPSATEWITMRNSVDESSTAGIKLKSSNYWEYSNSSISVGTDDYGFSAVPGGFGYYDRKDYTLKFSFRGRTGHYWSDTEAPDPYGVWDAGIRIMQLDYGNNAAQVVLVEKDNNVGRSVRCVMGN